MESDELLVDSVDETEPVELIEVDESEGSYPPEDGYIDDAHLDFYIEDPWTLIEERDDEDEDEDGGSG